MKTYTYPQEQFMEYLQEAADNGEVILLTYYGGTHPGDTRPVVPKTVLKTRFHGLCIQTGIEKTYLYEKCYFPQMFGVQKRNEFVDVSSRFSESSKRFDRFSKTDITTHQTALGELTTGEKPSITQRGWFIFVWYVVFFPVGVTLTLVNPRYSKQKKAVIVLLFAAFLCVILSMSQPQTPPA